eukprot:364290-Chlamydomonas_euryale.AAC.9
MHLLLRQPGSRTVLPRARLAAAALPRIPSRRARDTLPLPAALPQHCSAEAEPTLCHGRARK